MKAQKRTDLNRRVNIPFFDLTRQISAIKKELKELFAEVLAGGSFILGEWVEKFERRVADYVGVNHAIGVASGTDALMLTYQALGIGQGEGLITTPLTFFATVGAMLRLGIRPFFVDVDPVSFNMNPVALGEFLEKECRISGNGCIHIKTGTGIKGIVPVHLFGQMAPMKQTMEVAQNYGLSVVEDAAQALGAWQEIDGRKRKAGSVGSVAAFSFYPTKNLGAFGDGGMVTTNDPDLAEKVRILRNHGQDADGLVREPGSCSRLDALQAAILSVKFRFLDEWNQRRGEIAKTYIDMLSSKNQDLDLKCPKMVPGNGHIWHQFVVRVVKREKLLNHMQNCGIGCNVYYRTPVHLQPLLKSFGYGPGDYPEAEEVAREALALPIWPELSKDEIISIVKTIDSFYTNKARSN
ncbi:MAG: DegT/DnrJ/EryC1/StrS family aminotransferase [Candidatus Helarchaeota archaeon]|nr:DegT/DnrJ/EryC1/StrS family aminotransferase [Candidatus Helarchaeota archaeon]